MVGLFIAYHQCYPTIITIIYFKPNFYDISYKLFQLNFTTEKSTFKFKFKFNLLSPHLYFTHTYTTSTNSCLDTHPL